MVCFRTLDPDINLKLLPGETQTSRHRSQFRRMKLDLQRLNPGCPGLGVVSDICCVGGRGRHARLGLQHLDEQGCRDIRGRRRWNGLRGDDAGLQTGSLGARAGIRRHLGIDLRRNFGQEAGCFRRLLSIVRRSQRQSVERTTQTCRRSGHARCFIRIRDHEVSRLLVVMQWKLTFGLGFRGSRIAGRRFGHYPRDERSGSLRRKRRKSYDCPQVGFEHLRLAERISTIIWRVCFAVLVGGRSVAAVMNSIRSRERPTSETAWFGQSGTQPCPGIDP
jgi:hypothetical protein